jgi:hypothetical protein
MGAVPLFTACPLRAHSKLIGVAMGGGAPILHIVNARLCSARRGACNAHRHTAFYGRCRFEFALSHPHLSFVACHTLIAVSGPSRLSGTSRQRQGICPTPGVESYMKDVGDGHGDPGCSSPLRLLTSVPVSRHSCTSWCAASNGASLVGPQHISGGCFVRLL